MSCELFDHLKTLGFSNARACVYEAKCRFANDHRINLIEVAESCKAAADEQESKAITEDDVLQEDVIRSLVSISRVN